jgi:pantoate kinase
MRLSRQFAEHVGLISQNVRTVLTAADKAGVVCSMPMFGDSVFTITDEENVEEIGQIFHEHGPRGQTIVSKIDQEGARLLQ